MLVLHLAKEASSLGVKVQVGGHRVLEAAPQELEEEVLRVLEVEVPRVEEFQEEEFQVVGRQEEVRKDWVGEEVHQEAVHLEVVMLEGAQEAVHQEVALQGQEEVEAVVLEELVLQVV